jgi:hypothetical protein
MNHAWLPPVERIVRSFAGLSDSAPPFALVEAARGTSRSLATLLSWWQLRGESLPGSLQAELDDQRHRQTGYTEALAGVLEVEPGVVPAKGPSVWGRYPAGLVRETADLDLWLPSAGALWRVARHLAGDGWAPDMVWAWRIAGGFHYHAVLKRPSRHAMLMARDRIELGTIAYQGDHVRRSPRLRRWPPGAAPTVADCLLWLVEELGERPARMRDVLDLAVLVEAAGSEGLDRVVEESAELVASYGAHGPLRQLVTLASRHYPEAGPLLARVRSEAGRRGPRLPWPLRRHPAVGLVSAAVALARGDDVPRPVRAGADEVLLAVQRTASLPRLLARGLPLYGMPVPGSGTGDGVVASFDGAGGCWLDTPIGRFVGTLGPAVEESWVERATALGAARSQVVLL